MDEQIAAFHAYRIDEEKKPMNKKQKIQSTIGYNMKKIKVDRLLDMLEHKSTRTNNIFKTINIDAAHRTEFAHTTNTTETTEAGLSAKSTETAQTIKSTKTAQTTKSTETAQTTKGTDSTKTSRGAKTTKDIIVSQTAKTAIDKYQDKTGSTEQPVVNGVKNSYRSKNT
ncbi:hypothetical protein BGX29_003576 [Mortierella sp. GBA35]|nr:hypothetical protein BGX29_003576 [Mortierella sp. GBA35]